MSFLYDRIMTKDKLKIRLEDFNNGDIYTESNNKAWLEAKKEIKGGKTIQVDFDEIKNEDDFIAFLKK